MARIESGKDYTGVVITDSSGAEQNVSWDEASEYGITPTGMYESGASSNIPLWKDSSGKYSTDPSVAPATVSINQDTGNVKITAPQAVINRIQNSSEDSTFGSIKTATDAISKAYKLDPDYKFVDEDDPDNPQTIDDKITQISEALNGTDESTGLVQLSRNLDVEKEALKKSTGGVDFSDDQIMAIWSNGATDEAGIAPSDSTRIKVADLAVDGYPNFFDEIENLSTYDTDSGTVEYGDFMENWYNREKTSDDEIMAVRDAAEKAAGIQYAPYAAEELTDEQKDQLAAVISFGRTLSNNKPRESALQAIGTFISDVVSGVVVGVPEGLANVASFVVAAGNTIVSAPERLLGVMDDDDYTDLFGDNVFHEFEDWLSDTYDTVYGDKRDLLYGTEGSGVADITRTLANIATPIPGGSLVSGAIKGAKSVTKAADTVEDVVKAVDTAGDVAKTVDTAGDVVKAADVAKTVDTVGDVTKAVDTVGDVVKAADAVEDVVKAVDTVGDVAKVTDTVGDVAKTVDTVGDMTKAVDTVGDVTKLYNTAQNVSTVARGGSSFAQSALSWAADSVMDTIKYDYDNIHDLLEKGDDDAMNSVFENLAQDMLLFGGIRGLGTVGRTIGKTKAGATLNAQTSVAINRIQSSIANRNAAFKDKIYGGYLDKLEKKVKARTAEYGAKSSKTVRKAEKLEIAKANEVIRKAQQELGQQKVLRGAKNWNDISANIQKVREQQTRIAALQNAYDALKSSTGGIVRRIMADPELSGATTEINKATSDIAKLEKRADVTKIKRTGQLMSVESTNYIGDVIRLKNGENYIAYVERLGGDATQSQLKRAADFRKELPALKNEIKGISDKVGEDLTSALDKYVEIDRRWWHQFNNLRAEYGVISSDTLTRMRESGVFGANGRDYAMVQRRSEFNDYTIERRDAKVRNEEFSDFYKTSPGATGDYVDPNIVRASALQEMAQVINRRNFVYSAVDAIGAEKVVLYSADDVAAAKQATALRQSFEETAKSYYTNDLKTNIKMNAAIDNYVNTANLYGQTKKQAKKVQTAGKRLEKAGTTKYAKISKRDREVFSGTLSSSDTSKILATRGLDIKTAVNGGQAQFDEYWGKLDDATKDAVVKQVRYYYKDVLGSGSDLAMTGDDLLDLLKAEKDSSSLAQDDLVLALRDHPNDFGLTGQVKKIIRDKINEQVELKGLDVYEISPKRLPKIRTSDYTSQILGAPRKDAPDWLKPYLSEKQGVSIDDASIHELMAEFYGGVLTSAALPDDVIDFYETIITASKEKRARGAWNYDNVVEALEDPKIREKITKSGSDYLARTSVNDSNLLQKISEVSEYDKTLFDNINRRSLQNVFAEGGDEVDDMVRQYKRDMSKVKAQTVYTQELTELNKLADDWKELTGREFSMSGSGAGERLVEDVDAFLDDMTNDFRELLGRQGNDAAANVATLLRADNVDDVSDMLFYQYLNKKENRDAIKDLLNEHAEQEVKRAVQEAGQQVRKEATETAKQAGKKVDEYKLNAAVAVREKEVRSVATAMQKKYNAVFLNELQSRMDDAITNYKGNRLVFRANGSAEEEIVGNTFDEVKKYMKEIDDTAKTSRDVVAMPDVNGNVEYYRIDPLVADLANFNTARGSMNKLEKFLYAESKFFRLGQTGLNIKSWAMQTIRDSFGTFLGTGALHGFTRTLDDMTDILPDDLTDIIKSLDANEQKIIAKYMDDIPDGMSEKEWFARYELNRGAELSPAATETAAYRYDSGDKFAARYGESTTSWQHRALNKIDDAMDNLTTPNFNKRTAVGADGHKIDLNPFTWNQQREQLMRRTSYNNAYTKALQEGYSMRQARIQAEFIMNNATTNFNRRMYHLGNLQKVVPYLGSAINGTKSFYRMWSLDPVGVTTRLVNGIIVPQMYFTAAALGDEETRAAYEAIPEYTKRNNIIIMNGTEYITIPIPQEVSALMAPFRQMVEGIYGANKHSFWELATHDALGLSPVDLTGFVDLDASALSDQTVLSRVESGVLRVFSQVSPPVMKSVFMLGTGYDPYTKKMVDTSYTYTDYTTGETEVMGSYAGAFGNAMATIFGDSVSAQMAEKIASSLIGTAGLTVLNWLASLGGSVASSDGTSSNLFETMASQVTAAYSGKNYTDAGDRAWKSTYAALEKEKEEMIASEEYQSALSIIGSDQSTEDAKTKARETILGLTQPFYEKVKTATDRLISYYDDTYDRNKYAATLALMNLNSDATESEDYYSGRQSAIDTMAKMGFVSTNDTSVFGYYKTNKQTGEVTIAYTDPVAILSMENITYGNQYAVHLENLKSILGNATTSSGKSLSDARSEMYTAYNNASSYDERDEVYDEWNKEVMSALSSYISKYGATAVLEDDDVMNYLQEWIKVPSYFMKNNKNKYVSLGNYGNKQEAYIDGYIRYIYGMKDPYGRY